VSFVLAAAFAAAALVGELSDASGEPPAAIALYLAIINFAVGVFNMMPGYPLDGGRVLRAALWARGRNLLVATRRASLAGQGLSFGLIAIGVVSILAGNFIGGAWFSTLEGTAVGELVNREFDPAPPDMDLNTLVQEFMLAKGQRCVPIVAGAELLGLLTMQDLRRVPREEWAASSVFKAMTPREKLYVVDVREDVTEAMQVMAREGVHQLPVLEGGLFIGFITRADVLRLMQLRSELGPAGSAPAS
jgi:CBS domain-containing protein